MRSDIFRLVVTAQAVVIFGMAFIVAAFAGKSTSDVPEIVQQISAVTITLFALFIAFIIIFASFGSSLVSAIILVAVEFGLLSTVTLAGPFWSSVVASFLLALTASVVGGTYGAEIGYVSSDKAVPLTISVLVATVVAFLANMAVFWKVPELVERFIKV